MTQPSQMIGKHKVQVDGDVVALVLEGTISSAEVVAIHDILLTVLKAAARCFVLIDSVRMTGTVGPEISRFLTEWHQANRLNGAVIVNDNPLLRATLSLIVIALQAVLTQQIPIEVVESEAAARTWISGQRQVLELRN